MVTSPILGLSVRVLVPEWGVSGFLRVQLPLCPYFLEGVAVVRSAGRRSLCLPPHMPLSLGELSFRGWESPGVRLGETLPTIFTQHPIYSPATLAGVGYTCVDLSCTCLGFTHSMACPQVPYTVERVVKRTVHVPVEDIIEKIVEVEVPRQRFVPVDVWSKLTLPYCI